jgi:hypothetical protein
VCDNRGLAQKSPAVYEAAIATADLTIRRHWVAVRCHMSTGPLLRLEGIWPGLRDGQESLRLQSWTVAIDRVVTSSRPRECDSFGEERCLLPPSGREVQEGIVKLEKERFEGTHRQRIRRTNERQIQLYRVDCSTTNTT